MKKYLSVLAFVKTHVDDGKTIWEALISLLSNVIIQRNIKTITTEIVCIEFESLYGFKIPMHPMNELINKMCHRGFIVKNGFQLEPKIDKIKNIIGDTNKFENYYDELIKSIQLYFESKYSIKVDESEVEILLIQFLNDFDADILSSMNLKNILPDVHPNKEHYYILNNYLIEKYSDQTQIEKLLNLVIANVCINSIFFSKSERKLSLHKTFIYLDTRIILRLSGLEGEFRKNEYLSMIELLLKCKVQLRLFQTHYNEVLGILDDCIYWMQNKEKYNSNFASPALRYFVENKYDLSDVIIFKQCIDKLLKQYSIKIDVYNYADENENQFMIDEEKMFKLIVNEYKVDNCKFEETSKENIIWNDVKAISAIFRKRKGLKPNSLENVTHAFLTINNALARSSREYLLNENIEFYQFQECMTDTFYASYLWFNTSLQDDSYLRKKTLANAMAYLELNPEIRRKYIVKLKELMQNKNIDEDTFYYLRSHQLPLDLLKDRTFNIPENFSDKLPEEIHEEIISRATNPIKSIVEEKDQKIYTLETKYSNEIIDKAKTLGNIDEYINSKAKKVTRIYVVLITLIVDIPPGILIFSDLIQSSVAKIVIGIFAFIINSIFVYYGYSIEGILENIYNYQRRKIKKQMKLV